jgi:hypothetical protein
VFPVKYELNSYITLLLQLAGHCSEVKCNRHGDVCLLLSAVAAD